MQLRVLAFLSACLLVACNQQPSPTVATTEQPAEKAQVQKYTVEQFMNIENLRGASFSHDEQSIYYSSDKGGVFNVYKVSVRGGDPVQLTQSETNPVYIISAFPNDDRLLVAFDEGGNEIFHIYLRDTDGQLKDLTPGKQRAQFLNWSEDRQSFFYISNARDPRKEDVYRMDLDSFEGELIFENDEFYSIQAVSGNGRYIALALLDTRKNNNIYLYDQETKAKTHLTPHEGDINYTAHYFSKDQEYLYYTSDEGSEFQFLKRMKLDGTGSELIEKHDWDVVFASPSNKGRYRVTATNADAATKIRIFDYQTNAYMDLPKLPQGDVTQVRISDSEALMSFYLADSKAPNNLYVYDLSSKESFQLTDAMNPEINVDDLVSAEVVRYKSFDGLEVPAILYRPKNHTADGKSPGAVWVHGGPGGQSRTGYSASLQFLVNRGYVVLAVNNRGSSGYGKTFFALDDRDHGKGDLQDCIYGKNFLIEQGYVDPDAVAIMGGSYGGFMTLAALAFEPDSFAAGVDIVGVSNWLRTLKSIPPWWAAYRRALYVEMGDPEVDEAYLREISPLFHAEKIKRPLLVLQGANDPRVLQVESDEIVEKVKKNGVPVEYIVFEDEGHGFRKRENRIECWDAIHKFLDTHLQPGEG
jgi:dipeptidyl aminopeptidase/acylaminoacyl peptidase